MRYRLHLRILLLRPGYPNPTGSAFPCCRLYYLPLSKPSHPHQESSSDRNTRAHVRGVKLFWWRWAESNRRPEVLRFEGITTILYAALTLPDPVAAWPQVALSPALQTAIPFAYTLELASSITELACVPVPCGATVAPLQATGLPLINTVGASTPVIVPPAVSSVALAIPVILLFI